MKYVSLIALLLLAFAPAFAAPETPAKPVHLEVTKPLTRVTDVLASLSRQTGTPILADDTAVDLLGIMSADKPSLEEALTTLVSLAPSLSWQRVYLPQSAPLPGADALSAQVRALKAIKATGLVVADPKTQSTVTLKTSNDTLSTPPDGMQVVYLVTDETVRAQREANKKAAEAKDASPVNQTVAGLSSAADSFGQMTADQQRQAIPQLMMQFGRMMQGLNPAVRDEMRQQFQQRRQQQQGNGGQ
ncbi:MAG: hypothetical protein M3Y28_10910 [Armatimonadota bacterium]|nr:hypothetical protein [Armatimonadota bacterium]